MKSNSEKFWLDVGQRLFAYSAGMHEIFVFDVVTTWTDGTFEAKIIGSRFEGEIVRGHSGRIGLTYFFSEEECKRGAFLSSLRGKV